MIQPKKTWNDYEDDCRRARQTWEAAKAFQTDKVRSAEKTTAIAELKAVYDRALAALRCYLSKRYGWHSCRGQRGD